MTHPQDHNLICYGCRRPRTDDYPCTVCGAVLVVHDNCGSPQHPEQLKPSNSGELEAVVAWMEDAGWEAHHNFWALKSDPEQSTTMSKRAAIHIYRTHQAQVAEAQAQLLDNLSLGLASKNVDANFRRDDFVILASIKTPHGHMPLSSYRAQLNPQKPVDLIKNKMTEYGNALMDGAFRGEHQKTEQEQDPTNDETITLA